MDTWIFIRENILFFLDTLLLGGLFWYQKYRNKILDEKLKAQKDILNSTNSLVQQQSNIIVDQKTLFETAMSYANDFDPKKHKDLVLREADIEYQEQIKQIEESHDNKINGLREKNKELKNLIPKVAEVVMNHTIEKYEKETLPLYLDFFVLLVATNQQEQEAMLSSLSEKQSKLYRIRLEKYQKIVPVGILNRARR